MSIENATSGNWVVESFTKSGKFITLRGSSVGYASHDQAFKDGDTVPYTLFDDDGNREAGYARYLSSNGRKLEVIEVTATLANGVYREGGASLSFPNGGTVACTFNARAFDELWRHIGRADNPHNVAADQVMSDFFGKDVESVLKEHRNDINNHVGGSNNPHNVTAAQVSQDNDQNGLGQNVQNAINKLNQNLVAHESAEGNVHNVKAGEIDLYPEIELADGDSVQDALETIYQQFKSSEVYTDYLHLNEVTGDETLLRIRRIDADDVSSFHHNHGDMPKPEVEAIDDANVGELMWEAEGGGLYGVKVGGVVVQIGGEGVIFEAPMDGLSYARKDGSWFEITPTLVQDEIPSAPSIGTLWYDTGTTAELYVYDGLQWVSMTGGGSGGAGGEGADNNTADNIPPDLEDKALVRTIDATGNGEWRQPTTADIVALNEEPVLMSPDTFNTPADQIVTQQEANWYLYNSITGGEGTGGLFVKKTGDTMSGLLRYKGKDSEHGTFKLQAEAPDDWDGQTYYGVQVDLAKGTTFRNRFTVSTKDGRAFEVNGNGEANFVFHTPRMPETDVESATSDKALSYGVNVKTAKDNFVGSWSANHYADENWKLKCNINGNDWTMISFDKASNCLGLYHLPDEAKESHHATSKKYVDNQIKASSDALESQIDNATGNFMPTAGGEFTGEVKYSNVNDNMASATTLMHKGAFDSVLDNFQMGDRRYHGIYINRALQSNKTPISIKSTTSNPSVPDFKIINNSSYNSILMFGQTGAIECGRSSSPFIATNTNELTTLKCVTDLIAAGGATAKSANKIFEYRETGTGTGPIAGGFTINDSRMKVAHTERIDGRNVTWNAATEKYDEMDADGAYTIYEILTSGDQRLVEFGTFIKVKIGVNSTEGSFRSTEFVVFRKVKQKSLINGREYALVIGGFF